MIHAIQLQLTLLSLTLLSVAHRTAAGAGTLLVRARGRERGQSTAEYALVLLGAASVALLLVAWAGRSNRIARLFDSVIDSVIGKIR